MDHSMSKKLHDEALLHIVGGVNSHLGQIKELAAEFL